MSSENDFDWQHEIAVRDSDITDDGHMITYFTVKTDKLISAIDKYGINTRDKHGCHVINFIDFSYHKEFADIIFSYDIDIYAKFGMLLQIVSNIRPYYGDNHITWVIGKVIDRDVKSHLLQKLIEKDIKGWLCTYICSKYVVSYEYKNLCCSNENITLLQFFRNLNNACNRMIRLHGIDYEQLNIMLDMLENHNNKTASFFSFMVDRLNIIDTNKKQRN